MTDYYSYFLSSKSTVVQLDTFEISHSKFTQTYYIVRNSTTGLTATLEDLSEQEFEYRPVQITPLSVNDDLDQAIKITLGDLGEILPTELDAVSAGNGFTEKPVVKYRAYRSDDLTAPLVGPYTLEVVDFNFNHEGATFEAKAPSLNDNRTGELYDITRFPMLRGFL